MMADKKLDEMTEAELAQFYEARKGDLSLWKKEPRPIRRRRGQGPSTSFAVRLTPAEIKELQAAAEATGKTVSDFIRTAALGTAREEAQGTNEARLRRALDSARAELREIRAALSKTEQELENVS
jgi:uncharacterized protein (DUF1778 family)